jgi:cobalt-zinc-cadmium efflux system outer membrane protein
MKGIFTIILFIFTTSPVFAESFEGLIGMLEKHNLVQSELNKAKFLHQEARKSGSWGDPRFSVGAVNIPKSTYSKNISMMSGIKFGLSQEISLSGKFTKLRESGEENSRATIADSNQLKREFTKMIWSVAIEKEKLLKEEKILKENLAWIKSMLRVSKKLYANGKVPQQAVLDIQIRKSELRAQIARNKFAVNSLLNSLSEFLSSNEDLDIDLKSIPWGHLEKWDSSSDDFDYKKIALEHKLRSSDLRVSANKRNLVPDLTFALSYTKRNNIDGLGDFVGATISFPLPTSSNKYASKKSATYQKGMAERKYRNYIVSKPRKLKQLENNIQDELNQLSILQKETLKYSKSSRDITAKSYSRGGADYLELLRSEFQYQSQRINEINLNANLKHKKVNYLFVKGDRLVLGSQQ